MHRTLFCETLQSDVTSEPIEPIFRRADGDYTLRDRKVFVHFWIYEVSNIADNQELSKTFDVRDLIYPKMNKNFSIP